MITRRAALTLAIGAAAASASGSACAPAVPPPTPRQPPPPPPPTATALPAPPTPSPPTPVPTPLLAALPTRPVATLGPAVAVAAPTATSAPKKVVPGVDVLLRNGLPLLKGKRLGLLTNPTGRTASGQSTIDALNSAYKLSALFSPEHGIRAEAAAGQAVDSSNDAQTGLPIYSLYGETTRPTDGMLRGLDALVYDIQDVGTRTYTYTSTLLELMKAAAQHGLPVVVLDRPNPIAGDSANVEGNVLDPRFGSFVGPAPIAMRYGMTIGELGQFFNTELQVGAELHVVAMDAWQRAMWFDDTGLDWVNPSPNIRGLSAAALYPGTVLYEGTNLSVGRGTDRPFEWLGAPWLDPAAWLARLEVDGVSFAVEDRTPGSDKFAGEVCHGLGLTVTDRQQLQPMAMGVGMLSALGKGLTFDAATFDGLAGTDQIRKQIADGVSAKYIAAGWQAQLSAFQTKRQQYLIY